MVLPIVHFNDPVLRKKGAPVTTFDAALAELAAQMIETMHAASGIGLAAQQIGRALQLCVVDLRHADAEYKWELDGRHPPKELFMPFALCNPVVKVLPSDDFVYEEGCLSFPGIRGDVVRPDVIRVTYQDLQGGQHQLICDDLLARCIQHEVDHLNGVLFIDRMEKKIRQRLDLEVNALAQRTREAAARPAENAAATPPTPAPPVAPGTSASAPAAKPPAA